MTYPSTNPNRYRLSPRETEVLSLVAQGFTSKQVADQLDVAKCTVDYHLEKIYRKFGVNNRVNAVRVAIQYGLIPMFPIFGESSGANE